MNNTVGVWYKHQNNLLSTPYMALMVRKEGIEGYGLYMHFSDTLHTVGGYYKYNPEDICLMLGYTKKLIKAKLKRVLSDYDLFDFYVDDDGIEYIGLEHLREAIESLTNRKINGAKGGRKRAENYKNKVSEEPVKEVTKEAPVKKKKVREPYKPKDFDTYTRERQLSTIELHKTSESLRKIVTPEDIEYMESCLKPE